MHSRITKHATEAGFKLDELPDDVIIPLEATIHAVVKDCANLIQQYSMMQVNPVMLSELIKKTYGI